MSTASISEAPSSDGAGQSVLVYCAEFRRCGSESSLPFEGDRILGLVLSKTLLLVNDAKIKDPTIVPQLS